MKLDWLLASSGLLFHAVDCEKLEWAGLSSVRTVQERSYGGFFVSIKSSPPTANHVSK